MNSEARAARVLSSESGPALVLICLLSLLGCGGDDDGNSGVAAGAASGFDARDAASGAPPAGNGEPASGGGSPLDGQAGAPAQDDSQGGSQGSQPMDPLDAAGSPADPDPSGTGGAATDGGAGAGASTDASAGTTGPASDAGMDPTGQTGGWSLARLVVDAPTPYSADVAINAQGHAAVVWEQRIDDDHIGVLASTLDPAANTWSAPVPIDPKNTELDGTLPLVGVDAAGNAIALWQRQNRDFTRVEVWANRFQVETAGWGEGEPITQLGGLPALAVGADGQALAVYSTFDLRFLLVSRRFDPATESWTAEEPVDSPLAGNASRPGVAANGAADMIVAWARGDLFSGAEPFARRYRGASGGWEAVEPLSGDSATIPLISAVAINEAGSAAVAWLEGDGLDNRIRASHYDAGQGAWGAAEEIGVGGEEGVVAHERVVIDGAGNVVAVWNKETLEGQSVWSNRYDAGEGRWLGPTQISPPDEDAQMSEVGIDGAGNAFTVWASRGLSGQISVARYDAAADRWQSPQPLDLGDMEEGLTPQLAVASDGSAIVAWTGWDQGIYENRYRPAPTDGAP